MKAINLPPDTSQADEWITPIIFRIGSKYYEVLSCGGVREMTDWQITQLFDRDADD